MSIEGFQRQLDKHRGVSVCTVQGRPSTVLSINSCPTVKVTWVVLTEVEVLIDSISPSCVISTDGFDAAATAIFRSITFTPENKQKEKKERKADRESQHIIRTERHSRSFTPEAFSQRKCERCVNTGT